MKLYLFSGMPLWSKLVLANFRAEKFRVPKTDFSKLQFDILVEREIFSKKISRKNF